MALAARYFDTATSRRHAVTLSTAEGELLITGEGWQARVPPATLRLAEKLGRGPRMIYFETGATCEVDDHAALAQLMAALGVATDTRVSRWQLSFKHALGAVLAVAALAGWGLLVGVPWVSDQLAETMPPATADVLGAGALQTLDKWVFEPSQISFAKRDALRARHAGLGGPPSKLHFRAGGSLGANAVALPDGSIVVTDELIRLAGSDDEIVAVLAHEVGHIAKKHHLRRVISNSLTAAAMAVWFGDVSALVGAVPTALIDSHYSRQAEREADAYAAHLLREQGLPTAALARMLERLEGAHTQRGKTDGREVTDYFSSHPDTAERVRALRAAS